MIRQIIIHLLMFAPITLSAMVTTQKPRQDKTVIIDNVRRTMAGHVFEAQYLRRTYYCFSKYVSKLIETPVYVQKPNTLYWDYLCDIPELTDDYIKRIKDGQYVITRPTEDPKETRITSLVITAKD
jgi:hypothetical protein